MTRRYIGIDIGGSSVKGGVVCIDKKDAVSIEEGLEKNYPQIEKNWGTHKSQISGQTKIDVALDVLRKLLRNKDIGGIGICTTGSVDTKTGIITDDQKEGYVGTNWPDILRSNFGRNIQIHVINDAKAAAWAEYIFWNSVGSGNLLFSEKYNNLPDIFAHIIVGSGVGSGLIIKGDIHHGAGGVAGEFGTLYFTPRSYINLGQDIESYAASTGIIKAAQLLAQQKHIDPAKYNSLSEINELYMRRDEIAKTTLDIASQAIGEGVVALVNIVGPSAITFGGGTIQRINPYFELIKTYVSSRAEQPAFEAVQIRVGKLGKDAGVLGAACLALSKPKNY